MVSGDETAEASPSSDSALTEPRRSDDLLRRRVFANLKEARDTDAENGTTTSSDAIGHAVEKLGPTQRWLGSFKRYISTEVPRLIIQPRRIDGIDADLCMGETMLQRSVELLLSSDRDRIDLVMHGVNRDSDWSVIERGCELVASTTTSHPPTLVPVLCLAPHHLQEPYWPWLRDHQAAIEVLFEPGREEGLTTGLRSLAQKLIEYGLRHTVRIQLKPTSIEALCSDASALMEEGFRDFSIEFAPDQEWTTSQKKQLATQLHAFGTMFCEAWARGSASHLLQSCGDRTPVRMDNEITITASGRIYASNILLHRSRYLTKFAIGHIDEGFCFDRYWMDLPSNEYLVDWAYPPKLTVGNQKVGRIFGSFHKWMSANYGAWPRATA